RFMYQDHCFKSPGRVKAFTSPALVVSGDVSLSCGFAESPEPLATTKPVSRTDVSEVWSESTTASSALSTSGTWLSGRPLQAPWDAVLIVHADGHHQRPATRRHGRPDDPRRRPRGGDRDPHAVL